ncbi:MAG: hypothetical protein SCK28_01470 [Bacillota bacterium]|nr:hypothetical protein [Bacillota bacterium]
MNDLIDYVKGIVESVIGRVYFEHETNNNRYPYAKVNFPSSNDDELREDFFLEIDIFDNILKQDTTRIEQLVNEVDKQLNRLKYLSRDKKFQVSIYRINRLMIPDPDPKVRHRQLRYQCKTYFLS